MSVLETRTSFKVQPHTAQLAGPPERRTTNPAWEFQWIISPYDVLKPYELRVRTALRPRCSREEIVEEYNRWRTDAK